MNTAVLVIDMQNGFCHPNGSLPRHVMALPGTAQVIDTIRGLLEAARAEDLPIIYTRHVWRAGLVDCPQYLARDFPAGEQPLVRGTWDAQIVDELEPHEHDVVIDKNRFDAFLHTDLAVVLRSLEADQLLVTGVMTNVCVESTVRTGSQLDYTMLVATDCTAGPEGQKEPSLTAMERFFAYQVAPWRNCFETVGGAPRSPGRYPVGALP
ncbi:cysteine hydrolase [Streptomyces oryzae]|uniref:Cysteine hydrolase n=1 Tax=Streptomyces oryzae TaxID=1434886 RepID=A0ABS3X926_9ACTN|nr:isochorismatase family cysteine hydrolase [Streptomyces oryzae]MBO8191829.1 cysteine hydrolase [Streptomyces oryzae]